MKIAYCGPISLKLLSDLVDNPDSLPEGYEYPLGSYLVRSYVSMGHDVCVVTSSNFQKNSRSTWKGNGLTIWNTNRRRYMKYVLDAYAFERSQMVRALQDYEPDIIHAQWTYEFAHAAHASGIPFVVTVRDSPWTIASLTRSWYRIYRAIYAHYIFNKTEHLTAISDYVAAKVRDHYSYSSPIKIIPNGLMPDLFSNTPHTMHKGDAVRFASVSGWDPRKNVKTLLRAFSKLLKKFPKAQLALIGGGLGKGEACETWAIRNNLDRNVAFLGWRDHSDIIEYLRTSVDIFVHSTVEESFCMTVLEAMAQGLPVVALPESGAIPWLLDNGNAGILAKSQCPDCLSEAMIELASDISLRDQLCRKAHRRAMDEFSLDKVSREYLELFDSILQNREGVS
ncbi:MAG: glycosyltransferase family 4 protein [Puniceicoccaceae bacterium]